MHLLPTSLALLLFAHTALADISTTIVTMTTPPTPTSTSYTNDQAFQNAILAATNFYRGEHNVSAVTWNSTSANYALSWSSKCNFDHSVSLPLPLPPLKDVSSTIIGGERLIDSGIGRTNGRKPGCGLRERFRGCGCVGAGERGV